MEDILNENLIETPSENEADETADQNAIDQAAESEISEEAETPEITNAAECGEGSFEAEENAEEIEEAEIEEEVSSEEIEDEAEEDETEEADEEDEAEDEEAEEEEEEEEAEADEADEEGEADEESEDNGVIDELSSADDSVATEGPVAEDAAPSDFEKAKAGLSSLIGDVAAMSAEGASGEEAEASENKAEKVKFKLTAPENLQSIFLSVCAKRGRKLIYSPKEVIFDGTYKVLGTDKKNEEGIKVKDIIDAEIKEGVRLGYLDRFDGLKTSEIKEEYENDIVYEFAEQEFKKTGLVLDGARVKVYIYDWDLAACHHVGYLDEEETLDLVPYLQNSENYSFDIYGIITGGKGKRVTKDENGKITVTKEKDGNIGIELDVSILKRKD
ncbi:MAG: hypothetical protein J6Y44_02810 [Clostridia bacterium]|nr:hypothetical protein [Clostridia bacterium]